MSAPVDAVVVGAGINGLAAAIELARAGRSVRVVEASAAPGGGCRSAELTLPGFVHDVCAAAHPFGFASPFLRRLPLEHHGLTWVHPTVPVAHARDDGAAVLDHSLGETAALLGEDGASYQAFVEPMTDHWEALTAGILAPLLRIPRHPVVLARFGLRALRSASAITRRFRTDAARSLFLGLCAHAIVPPGHATTASFGLVLAAAAHTGGWPFPRGGAGRLTDALVGHLDELGVEIECDRPVRTRQDLPATRVVILETAPAAAEAILGERAASGARRRLRRFRHGPGVCKVDYALRAPVPWKFPELARAGTVHLGGRAEEVRRAQEAVAAGGHPERPFVIVTQPSRFDDRRAPAGHHTLWAYCHVPNGSTRDVHTEIEAQIERFAPGFGDTVLARHVRTAADYERYDATFVGGDIAVGAQDGLQVVFRPGVTARPYRLGPGAYLCSAATPPGGGIHGMCGRWAARAALRAELA